MSPCFEDLMLSLGCFLGCLIIVLCKSKVLLCLDDNEFPSTTRISQAPIRGVFQRCLFIETNAGHWLSQRVTVHSLCGSTVQLTNCNAVFATFSRLTPPTGLPHHLESETRFTISSRQASKEQSSSAPRVSPRRESDSTWMI